LDVNWFFRFIIILITKVSSINKLEAFEIWVYHQSRGLT